MRKPITKLFKVLQDRFQKENKELTKLKIVIECDLDSRYEDGFNVVIETIAHAKDQEYPTFYKYGPIQKSTSLQAYLKEAIEDLAR